VSIEEALALLLLWIIGTVTGLVITGFLADRLVVRKIMRNKDIQDLVQLFREGKTLLKEMVENEKRKRSKSTSQD
jgi:uncharacterized membrane protein YesL